MQYITTEFDESEKPYKYIKSIYDYVITDLSKAEIELKDLIDEKKKIIKISNDDMSTIIMPSILQDKYKDINVIIISNKYSSVLIEHLLDISNKKIIESINKISNITFIDVGLDEFELEMLKALDISTYELEQIFKKDIISKKITNTKMKTFILIDIESLKINQDDNGLNITNLTKLTDMLKSMNIIGIDMYNYTIVNERDDKKKSQLCKIILKDLFGINETKINIYNDNSKFLIYRPSLYRDEADIGWYILRGLDKDTKEKILKKIEDDNIIEESIEYNGEVIDVMITSTTIKEQNDKSFFSSTNSMDLVLFPEEKTDMLFELIN
jgi:hypothetical protein